MNRRRLHAALAIVISGGAAIWFFSGVEWGALRASLVTVRPGWVAAAVALLLFEFVLRSIRWKVLLRPLGGEVRIRDLFDAQVIGAAANTIFPFRAGELAKPLVAADRTGHPITTVIATTVMERVYDLFGMLSVLLVMVAVLPANPEAEGELVTNLKVYGGLFGIIAMACMAIFFGLATHRDGARGQFARLVAIAPKPVGAPFLKLFDGFVAGLGNTRDRTGLLQAGALSVWMWMDGAIAIWCLFQAFGMDLPFGSSCFTAVAIALTVALPQAPGFIGVFHIAMEKTMILWGQPAAEAQGFAIVFWAVSFLPVTLVGLTAMWRAGFSRDQLRRAEDAHEPALGEE